MIDFYNKLFTLLSDEIKAEFEDISILTEYVKTPSEFPCVTIDEISNVPVYRDSDRHTKYARLRYRIQIFSNKESGKRNQARKIHSIIENFLVNLGFEHKSYSTIPSIYNSNIYQITTIYQAVIDKKGVVYRR